MVSQQSVECCLVEWHPEVRQPVKFYSNKCHKVKDYLFSCMALSRMTFSLLKISIMSFTLSSLVKRTLMSSSHSQLGSFKGRDITKCPR
jgi:hypothetical protein